MTQLHCDRKDALCINTPEGISQKFNMSLICSLEEPQREV